MCTSGSESHYRHQCNTASSTKRAKQQRRHLPSPLRHSYSKKIFKKYTIFYLRIRFYRDMENIRNLRTVIKSYVSDRWPLGLQRIWDCYSKGKLLRITKTVTQDEQFFCILLLFSLLFVSFKCYFTFYTLSLLVNILF